MRQPYQTALAALADKGRLRALAPRVGHDFSSNDYLGLAQSSELRDATLAALERGVPVGSGGSRLLRGNHPEHEAVESEAAQYFGAESTLFFAGGYMANFAIFSTLPQKGDLVVHAGLIHASVHEGMRRGRAEFRAALHNDVGGFEAAIVDWRRGGGKGRPWLAVESLYSMDGDSPPLADLMGLADRHDGILVVDEAHATGVLGPDGRGLAAGLEGRENVITLHTCGKALGCAGAFICSPRVVRECLVNRCRPFSFATAPPPLQAATARAALQLSRNGAERRAKLARLIAFTGARLQSQCGVAPSGSQIQPVIVGEDRKAVALAAVLTRQGYDIRAIRPPTVPEGTARLRMALTLNVGEAEVSGLIDALAEAMRTPS